MAEAPLVDILLSTYNGEDFLSAQLDSIHAQTCQNWRLLVRDDGSTDSTLKLLQDWGSQHPQQVQILADTAGTLGPARSFESLALQSTAPYVMFCDQDDRWSPHKVERFVQAAQQAEQRQPPETPLLVHGDLRLIDAQDRLIHASFWEFQGFDIHSGRCIQRLMIENVITGCSTLLNKRLLQLAFPLPAQCIMHDWWIGLVAASRGSIVSLAEPLTDYRQHGSNMQGTSSWSPAALLQRVIKNPLRQAARARTHLGATFAQAAALQQAHADAMPPDVRARVDAYVAIPSGNWLGRRMGLIRGDHWVSGPARKLGLMLLA